MNVKPAIAGPEDARASSNAGHGDCASREEVRAMKRKPDGGGGGP
jgi:hypothetical protein